MKALTVFADWGMLMYQGDKTIEVRTWNTPYRGNILFCTGQQKIAGCISGHALFVARLEDVQPFEKKHLEASALDTMPKDKSFAWILKDFKAIYPFPVKGKQGFFEVDDSLIRFIPDDFSDAAAAEFIKNVLSPLIYKPARL